MKLSNWNTKHTVSLFALMIAGATAACSGDDSTPATGGSSGSTGTGGSAGSGGSAGAGGTAGTTGTGGSAGTAVTDGSVVPDTSDAPNCVVPGALFTFDSTDGGSTTGWSIVSNDTADSGLVGTVGYSATEGHTCAGALVLTAPFTTFGTQEAVTIQYNFGQAPTPFQTPPYRADQGPVDFTGKTKLHFWFKLQVPDAGSVTSYLNGVQGFLQSGDTPTDAANGYRHYTTGNSFTVASTLADGGWHEATVDFNFDAGDQANLSYVNQLGAQVLALTAPLDGGPAGPSTTVLLIDDISLE